MSATHRKWNEPSWMSDTLEGHAGNALMMQAWLDEDIRPDQKELMRKRLELSLADLAIRMDGLGLRKFETARVRVVRTVNGAQVSHRKCHRMADVRG